VVGLTGGISTGKSTVSNLLRSKDLPIVDADVIARQVVEPGSSSLSQIVKTFGPEVLQDDGSLDRKKLGSIVFNDEEKRKKLNGIVHPAVRKAMLLGVVKYWMAGHKVCVVDVPLLIESGLWRFVATTVVVYCDPETQLTRLMKRDGSTREEASSRLNSQKPITEKLQYADYVIDNSGNQDQLRKNVDEFVEKVNHGVWWTWRLKWIVPPYGVFAALWTMAWRSLYPVHRRRKESGRKQS
jgi:dephospho-CoA kinase